MKARFILFRRAGVFYCEDTKTRKQTSLRTKDEAEAITLLMLNAKNESFRQPRLNVQIARAYLTASDPAVSARTWQAVMDEMQTHGKPATQTRCARAMQGKAFDSIRRKALLETGSEDLLAILKTAKVLEAHYLRRLHNLAVGLGWLPWSVLAPKLWPAGIQGSARHHAGRAPAHPRGGAKPGSATSTINCCGKSARPRATPPR